MQNAVFVFSDLGDLGVDGPWRWSSPKLAAAWSLGSRQEWARWFAIGVAACNAVGQLAFLPAYPFWAVSLFAVDIFVIYALCMYGSRRA